MKKLRSSTTTQPLLFFEQFLRKEYLLSFEKAFYGTPTNPSFKAYKDLGYIEYVKDLYENDEAVAPVKVFFKDVLYNRLKLECDITLKLIIERKEEIENIQKTSKIYIHQQISKLNALQNSLNITYSFRTVIDNCLDKIMENLLIFLDGKPPQDITNRKISSITYFDLKKEVKPKHLRKLYEVTVLLNVIDDEMVSEEEFFNVLTLPQLPDSTNKILFNVNNRHAVYYLNTIAVYFNDFKPSKISRSQSFIKKNGVKHLNDNIINNINTFLKNNDVSKYKMISDAIEQIVPK